MRKDFYLFRHGQTDFNKERRWAGCGVDIDLNETGVQQAQNLAENLQGKGIEVIFASNLVRARHTAEIAAQKLGVKTRIKTEFHEGNFGIGEGRLLSELEAENPQLRADWNNLSSEYMDVRYPGGESKQEIQERMFQALKDLLKEDYAIMGVASHGAAIRYLLMRFGVVITNIPNGKPFHLIFEDGKWYCELSD